MRYTDLRQKEVINICDGRKLGNVVDLEIECETGRILAIVVPTGFNFAAVFRSEPTGVAIPWPSIVKIGDDAILVQLEGDFLTQNG